MLDVENGEVLLRGQLASGAVACMSWAEEAPSAGSMGQLHADGLLLQNGAARFFGAPAAPVPPPGRVPPQVRPCVSNPLGVCKRLKQSLGANGLLSQGNAAQLCGLPAALGLPQGRHRCRRASLHCHFLLQGAPWLGRHSWLLALLKVSFFASDRA